jgi:hypothetical protein
MQSFLAAAAAPLTAADKLRQIPFEFWWKIGLGIAVIVATVIILRKVAKTNKVFLGVGVFLVGTIIGFNWIYERNEPKWASPAVNWLGGFLPTKGQVATKGHG